MVCCIKLQNSSQLSSSVEVTVRSSCTPFTVLYPRVWPFVSKFLILFIRLSASMSIWLSFSQVSQIFVNFYICVFVSTYFVEIEAVSSFELVLMMDSAESLRVPTTLGLLSSFDIWYLVLVCCHQILMKETFVAFTRLLLANTFERKVSYLY